jgi:N-carbamoyl-L-amino-acid hydrolase
MALFEFVQQLNQDLDEIRGENSVWTIGLISLTPNARSIVPGLAECNLQFRDPEQSRLEDMRLCAFALVDDFNRQQAVQARISVHDESAQAVEMDDTIQSALASAAQRCVADDWRHMPSGAAHDAQVLAAHMPAGMLFIPSIGGISHDFAEDSHEDDIVLGCQVLAEAVLQLLDGEHQS